jgi:hypothetical protein
MKKYENTYLVKREHVLVKVIMNLKISACSYRQVLIGNYAYRRHVEMYRGITQYRPQPSQTAI